MNLAEQLIAGLALSVCVVLLVRLGLGRARQQRFDHAVRTFGRRLAGGIRRGWQRLTWERRAAREARAAIERARTGRSSVHADDGEWKGNVYTPKRFRKPRKPH